MSDLKFDDQGPHRGAIGALDAFVQVQSESEGQGEQGAITPMSRIRPSLPVSNNLSTPRNQTCSTAETSSVAGPLDAWTKPEAIGDGLQPTVASRSSSRGILQRISKADKSSGVVGHRPIVDLLG